MKPEEIAVLDKLHSPRFPIREDGKWHDNFCSYCRIRHPCPTARLIKHIQEQDTIIARLSNIPR